MKQIYNYFLGVSSLAMLATFSSCSSDDLGSPAGETREVNMSVVLSKGDISRSALAIDGGNLACRWTVGDQVVVATEAGTKLGVLSLKEGQELGANAVFEGKLTGSLVDGKAQLRFLYYGNKTNAANVGNPETFVYSAQTGTLASLSDYDFFSTVAPAMVSGNQAVADGVVAMDRKTAFGRFSLVFPEGVEPGANTTVTVSGENLATSAKISLNGNVEFGSEAAITVGGLDPATGDLWLTILPDETKKISLTFTATVGDVKYSGSLTPRTWKAGEYVRKTIVQGSEFAGVPVDMTPEQTETPDDPGKNEYGEPLNNPLAKWAKGNLYRVDGLTNGIAESETENGALYQWGRNYGYMDTKGFYDGLRGPDGTLWDPGEDFTNYLDAFGSFEYDGYSRTFDYYITNPDNQFVGTATDFNANGGYIDVPRKYETVDELKAQPMKYFMDYGTKTGDYWIKSFGDGGATWYERAGKCGYEQTNPCPEGWRLPTLAEFQEIAPQVNKEKAATLTNLLMNSAELRETESGIRYVIRWLNKGSYVEIQSLVVNDKFSDSDISTVIWDNNDKVVKRTFPFTGNINDLFGYDRYLGVYYARPYKRGPVDQGVFTVGYNMVTIIGPGGNCGDALGAYWIGDCKQAFKFIDKSTNSYDTTSCLLIEAGDPEMGYAIRPVRDDSNAVN